MMRSGFASGDSAANLLGTTRAFHLSPSGTRRISGGVIFSLPGQNGQFGENDSGGLRSRFTTIWSGRLARSVAITTHSLVMKFWRSSGMKKSPRGIVCAYFVGPAKESLD
jgi:hypothetical protein